jgi:DNA-binding MarR family transcriptional regulator
MPDWKRKRLFKSDTKLTNEQVTDIRQRYAAGGVTQYALAAEYGIDQGHVSAIVNGKKRKGGGGS